MGLLKSIRAEMRSPFALTALRASELEVGNPLPRAAFLLVFLGESAVRVLLGQEGADLLVKPLPHGLCAAAGVGLFCWIVDRLYDSQCPPPIGQRPDEGGLSLPRPRT